MARTPKTGWPLPLFAGDQLSGGPMPVKMTFDERLAEIQGAPDECWLWRWGLDISGYGKVWASKRTMKAHRVSYEMHVGPIPDGLVIDHLCRVRACINPAHLRVVTQRENVLCGEGIPARNAKKTHCPKGHEYTIENTKPIMNRGLPGRECRTCHRERDRRIYWEKKWEAIL